MHRSARLVVVAIVLSSALRPAHAQTADPSGHWEGAFTAQGKEIAVEIDLVRNAKGTLAGVVSIPSQNVKTLPLANFVVDGQSITFQIVQSAPGDNTFKGTLAANGASLSGTFTHDVYNMPYTLNRTGAPRMEPPAVSTAIGKELEGTWNGTLDANGKVLRVALKLSNQPDGTAAGTLVSLDQDNAEFPIQTITQTASNVTFDIKAVGGVYKGTVNAAGTELAGTWTQGAAPLPLTFHRPAAADSKPIPFEARRED